MEILPAFVDASFPTLLRDAVGITQRLREDGKAFWPEDSKQYRRWRKGCVSLEKFLKRIDSKRYRKQPLEDVLAEFFRRFEHLESRARQLLYQPEAATAEQREQTRQWLALTYRACVSAITAAWLEYKRVCSSVEININLATGESTERWTRQKMKVPRRYGKPPRDD